MVRKYTCRSSAHLKSKDSSLHLKSTSADKSGWGPAVKSTRESDNFRKNGKYINMSLRYGGCRRPGFPEMSRASSVFSCAASAFKNIVSMRSVSPQRRISKPRKCARRFAAASTVDRLAMISGVPGDDPTYLDSRGRLQRALFR